MIAAALTLIATLVVSTLAAAVAVDAQQVTKAPRVGVLFASTPAATGHLLDGLRQGLREHGYVVGRDIILESRYGEAGVRRMSELASELVRGRVDVLVAATDPATAALRQQTRSIPIVMANSTDPVGTGFVVSLARPGGNVTGLSALSPELSGKRLGLLRDLVPALARVAIIWNPDVRGALLDYKETEGVARSIGVQIQSIEVSRDDDLDRAFSEITSQQAQAVMVQTPNPILFARRTHIASFAQKSRLPSIYGQKEFTDAGGLISYGPSTADLWRRSATYVHKILKGAKPAELPVEQPVAFELALNLKTAKVLGLVVSPSLLQQANHVIQ